MKLVALSACHNLYCQSHLSMALLINTSCLSFTSDLKHHDPLNATEKKPPWHVVLDNKITLLLKRKKKSNLSVCLLYTTHPHTNTHCNTWLIRYCCSASNIITLLPTLVSMETSFQSWLAPDRCESAQTKNGRWGGGLFVFKHD